jgi:ATP-dependent Clp protease ATP-binding subunit ClpC
MAGMVWVKNVIPHAISPLGPHRMCDAGSVFERFDDLARQSIVRSQQEARSLNQPYVGTEHLLLGLLEQHDPRLTPILESHGIDVEGVRNQVTQTFGGENEPPTGHIPFTPQAKKALELALREALELGHNHIGPAHLLLGVVRHGDNGGVQTLGDLHVNVEELAHEIRSQSGGEA